MTRPAAPLLISTRGVIATIVIFLVAAGCVRLGFWQLDRLAQRRALNEVLLERAAGVPITQPELLRDSVGLPYRTALLRGRYDHGRSIVLPGRSYRGAPGVHLLTPFRLDGASHAVLVNRGWVPAADGATIDFDYFGHDTTTVASGILLPLPARMDSRGRQPAATAGPAPVAADTFRRLWYAVDQDVLRRQFPYPLADVQLQLLADEMPTTAPLPAARPSFDDGSHLGYAIQWFSFAIIGLVGWAALVLRGRSRTGNADDGVIVRP